MRPAFFLAVLTAGVLCCSASLTAQDAPEATLEEQAIEALKRLRTNIQFNKDGTTRLLRLSKSVATDEALTNLQHFKQLDYLAIVCPQITDANTQHIAALSNLETLLLSK